MTRNNRWVKRNLPSTNVWKERPTLGRRCCVFLDRLGGTTLNTNHLRREPVSLGHVHWPKEEIESETPWSPASDHPIFVPARVLQRKGLQSRKGWRKFRRIAPPFYRLSKRIRETRITLLSLWFLRKLISIPWPLPPFDEQSERFALEIFEEIISYRV